MNWIQRKIYLYNVTFGLYMLDWWERYLFNFLILALMWFLFNRASRHMADFLESSLGYARIQPLMKGYPWERT